jgi:hypothetical protein
VLLPALLLLLLLHITAISPGEYGYGDIYNMCALHLARKFKKPESPAADDILYDLPILWFNQEWWGPTCQTARGTVDDTRWKFLATSFFAMHTRYPKYPYLGEDSPLVRSMRIINGFFNYQCTHVGCLPTHGADLIAYEDLNAQDEPA